MSIRNIIEAATYEDYPPSFGHADQAFIATFNSEHVALMEAVIESIDTDHAVNLCQMDKAHKALEAYRKERGLND